MSIEGVFRYRGAAHPKPGYSGPGEIDGMALEI